MKSIFGSVKILPGLLLVILFFASCEEKSTDDNSRNGPGVLDNNLLIFNCNVVDGNTNSPISGAVVEWDQVGTWAGSIVYPRSGTTNSLGKFSIEFIFPTAKTTWSLNVTRAYVPAGGYNPYTRGIVIPLAVNNPKTLTLHLYPL